MIKTRCNVCWEIATQRIVIPGLLVKFRCHRHLVDPADATQRGWLIFNLQDEGVQDAITH